MSEEVEAAHDAAVTRALEFLQAEAGYTRVGGHGVFSPEPLALTGVGAASLRSRPPGAGVRLGDQHRAFQGDRRVGAGQGLHGLHGAAVQVPQLHSPSRFPARFAADAGEHLGAAGLADPACSEQIGELRRSGETPPPETACRP